MTPHERRAMRREQVERCLSADMTIKDWCALNRVAESTIYGWMARFRKEEPELFDQPTSHKWIELSKESLRSQTALATSDSSPAIPAQTAKDTTSAHLEPIAVHIRNADIIIPAGSHERDIASVLRAVAAL